MKAVIATAPAVVTELPAAVAVAVLTGALLVGGSLSQLPSAGATENSTPRGSGGPSVELKLTGLQLPTI